VYSVLHCESPPTYQLQSDMNTNLFCCRNNLGASCLEPEQSHQPQTCLSYQPVGTDAQTYKREVTVYY